MTPPMNPEAAVRHLRRADKRFAPLIKQFGLPQMNRRVSAHHMLTRAIVFQQLHGKAARTIFNRFCALYPDGKFPKPEVVSRTSLKKLTSVGLSRQKATYIVDLADKFSDGTIRPRRFARMEDVEISECLIQVKGVGQWTADMFLMFHLGRPDILPVGDLGVRKGMQRHFELVDAPDVETMIELAEPWMPYRTAASWYMWRWLDMETID